jgi:hypothetical protein
MALVQQGRPLEQCAKPALPPGSRETLIAFADHRGMMRRPILVLALLIATMTTARSTPNAGFEWLQGRWLCDGGGYDGAQRTVIVARIVGPSYVTMAWESERDDIRYELRRHSEGTWNALGRAEEKSTHDYVAWNLEERSAKPRDVMFEGTARMVKSRVQTEQMRIRWQILETGPGKMAQWRWYFIDGHWTNAQSKRCRLLSA